MCVYVGLFDPNGNNDNSTDLCRPPYFNGVWPDIELIKSNRATNWKTVCKSMIYQFMRCFDVDSIFDNTYNFVCITRVKKNIFYITVCDY